MSPEEFTNLLFTKIDVNGDGKLKFSLILCVFCLLMQIQDKNIQII